MQAVTRGRWFGVGRAVVARALGASKGQTRSLSPHAVGRYSQPREMAPIMLAHFPWAYRCKFGGCLTLTDKDRGHQTAFDDARMFGWEQAAFNWTGDLPRTLMASTALSHTSFPA